MVSIEGCSCLAVLILLWLLAPLARRLMTQSQRYDRLLISIPYSHFVEAARWAMERRGLRVREIKLPIGPHALVVPIFRLLFRGGLSSTTSFPGEGFKDSWIPTMTNVSLRRLAGVPLVIHTRTETCLPDSWSVLEDCQLPVCQPLKDRWDRDFGPSVRQAGYYYIFQQKELYRQIQSCHFIFMFFHDLFEYSMNITGFMKRMMSMTPEDVAAAEARITAEFEAVSSLLERHAFLGDGTGSSVLGGADIAFCALSGWVVYPENFHHGQVNLPAPEFLPQKYQDFMKRIKSTRAARHVSHCYKEYRTEVAKL